MAEIPFLVKDLALILMVAGIVTLLFKKLKQPLVLGYIVAGFLVSPHMPYTMSVIDDNDIQTWADIGVIFTLFSLGLDFSFKKIVKMGASPIISTVVIVFCMMMLGISVGHGFGWNKMDCIFLGGMLAMSSTTIIYKAFDEVKAKYFADDDAFCERSWGMSHDYPIAIQHGATLVRVGTAIFGPRIY